jgi:hypothetical protein
MLAVNDMLIPKNNFLPLYNNFLGGPASCEDALGIFRRPGLEP